MPRATCHRAVQRATCHRAVQHEERQHDRLSHATWQRSVQHWHVAVQRNMQHATWQFHMPRATRQCSMQHATQQCNMKNATRQYIVQHDHHHATRAGNAQSVSVTSVRSRSREQRSPPAGRPQPREGLHQSGSCAARSALTHIRVATRSGLSRMGLPPTSPSQLSDTLARASRGR